MQAVTFAAPGSAEVLQISEGSQPIPGPEELLVKVHAAGVNRADIQQRLGNYPPPPEHSPILGLEIAGEVVACGTAVKDYRPGDKVFGLVNGGGYADYCVIDYQVAMPIPATYSYIEAAGIAEVFLTAEVSIIELGELKKNEVLLIHAGASGIGTAAIQMAKQIGATVLVTVGSELKQHRMLALGADRAINYHQENFSTVIKELFPTGIDVILDPIGGDYFSRNLQCLGTGGRLVQIAALKGNPTELSLGRIIMKRLQIKGNSMRNRSLADKRAITARFKQHWLPLLANKKLQPIIDTVFPLEAVQKAHQYLESNRTIGKVILTIGTL